MKKYKMRLIIVGIVAAGILGAVILVKTKPEAEKKMRSRMTAVVRSIAIEKTDTQARISVTGTVEAKRSIQLKAQVVGRIEEVAQEWVEGGRVEKGAILLRLEEADYKTALAQAQRDMALAQTELTLEMGRQDVAKREWELLGGKGSDTDRDMVLRVPHLKSAKAGAAAATARLEQARLNLTRTQVTAPFNAVITRKSVDVGDQASVQSSLGVLVDTDSYYVRISIPADELNWIVFPSDSETGSPVKVTFPDGMVREGSVVRMLSSLTAKGSMAQVIAEIRDPLKKGSAVLLGSYVGVTIEGKMIEDSYSVLRDHYREGGEVWLLTKDGKLRVVPADPVWSDRRSVVFRADIADGDELITSDLGVVIDGMELRREGAPEKPASGKKGSKRD